MAEELPTFGSIPPRRGRRPLPPEQRRSSKSLVSYRREDYRLVCRAAQRAGITAAEYAYRATLAQAESDLGERKIPGC